MSAQHQLTLHKRCYPIGTMVWDPDGDFCACRECGTSWVLTEKGWKVQGLVEARPQWRGKRK